MLLLIPTGLTGSVKTPGAYSEVRYAQARGGIGSIPRYVLLVGYKVGSAATDYEIFDVTDPTEGITKAGEGSELAGMIETAFQTDGVLVKACAVPEPSGGAQAALDIVVSGTAAKAGSFSFWLDDEYFSIGFQSGATPTQIGDLVETEIAARANIFCSPNNVTGTVTNTALNKGARGNSHIAYLDDLAGLSGTGVTVALSGGTALANGAVPFAGGSGVETITTVLNATLAGRYDYTAWGANTSTEVAAISAQGSSKGGPFGPGPENMVFGHNGTQSAASTLSQNSCNQALGQVVWQLGRTHPSKLAAAMASYRSVIEAAPVTDLGDPNHRFDREVLPGVPSHFRNEHIPSRTVTDVCLNSGVTPIGTRNNLAVIVLAITARSLDGATPDYRVLDVSKAVVPQRVREHIDDVWENEHAVANPHVAPDPPDGKLPAEGVSTPKLWAATINAELARFGDTEEGQLLLEDPAGNLAVVQYNATLGGGCLVANIPTKVLNQNHLTATVVRQIG